MKYPNIFLLLFLFFSLSVNAQEDKGYTKTRNAKKSLQIAEHHIGQGEYGKAERQLLYTIRMKKNFAVAYRELGKIYLITYQFEKAIETFEKSFDIDRKLSRAAFFECGEAFFKMGKSDEAFEYYEKYERMKGRAYANANKESALEIEYDERLEERKENLAYLEKMETPEATANNLGTKFNSKDDDYIPTITNDGETLIFTRRKVKNGKEDVFVNNRSKNSEWGNSSALSNINTDKNEGMAKFSTHSKSFFFAGCHRPESEGGCDLYEAQFKNGSVQDVKQLTGKINSEKWDSQPSVSCDGRMLFFSSIQESGFGGADIYVSYRGPSGNWSQPENLGRQINTKGDEEAPFIAPDGRTLYFTSNGHPGQGEGDIYMTKKEGTLWTTPVNLGPAVNSTGKELGFFIDGDGKSAYFSSSKFGGEGGLDIYHIELPEEFRPELTAQMEGFVIDADTKKPIQTLVKVGTGNEKWDMFSDEDGWFYMCVAGNKAYSFQVEVEGYEYFVEAVYVDQDAAEKKTSFYIELQPIKKYVPTTVKTKIEIKREQFFFGFDSDDLSDESKIKLNKVVDLLSEDNSWKIEVIGFADKKGNAKYNKKLSERRAQAIVDFLSRNGVNTKNVILSEGRGSIAQANTNNDDFYRRVDLVLKK